MYQRGTSLLALLWVVTAHAQSWCVPGATWTFDAPGSLGGYVQFSYVGDTLIDGEVAQIIDQYNVLQQVPDLSILTISYASVARITKLVDDVVYAYNPDVSPSAPWDTLYWFGAQVGSRWRPPHMNCSPLNVTATGTGEFGGVQLRYLDIGPVHRIYERFGYLWHIALNCPGILVLEPASLRCYSDVELSVQFGPAGCLDLVSVAEHEVRTGLAAFPNPGTTHFTLSAVEGSLPPGPHTITLFDATGRMVLHQRTNDARPVIGTEALPTGLYRITVRDDRGAVMGATWVKAQ